MFPKRFAKSAKQNQIYPRKIIVKFIRKKPNPYFYSNCLSYGKIVPEILNGLENFWIRF